MDATTFDVAEPLLDQVADIADQQLASPELQRLLTELAKAVGEKLSVNITFLVDVSDETGERSLPLLTTGLSAFSGKEPFRTWGDSSPQRYVVEDGIRVVPHDRCPTCWGEWDFKFDNPTCPKCASTLGKDCKVLLDTDECPQCEEGKVTVAEPRCKKCGFRVDSGTVVWG
jgi:hypothetical protein